MPDTRKHRGAHPQDPEDFGPGAASALIAAASELSFLLEHDYSAEAALKLVGDHHQLKARQRAAVLRAACGDRARARRLSHRVADEALRAQAVALDGFNCLISVEAMLSGAPLFRGRDSALRDLSSVHGTYRSVTETERAIEWMLETLARREVASLRVLLDRPVGNSGRTRAAWLEHGAGRPFALEVQLCDDVDRTLAHETQIVGSSDSWILDRAQRWFDLPALVARDQRLCLWLVDFFGDTPGVRSDARI